MCLNDVLLHTTSVVRNVLGGCGRSSVVCGDGCGGSAAGARCGNNLFLFIV